LIAFWSTKSDGGYTWFYKTDDKKTAIFAEINCKTKNNYHINKTILEQ